MSYFGAQEWITTSTAIISLLFTHTCTCTHTQNELTFFEQCSNIKWNNLCRQAGHRLFSDEQWISKLYNMLFNKENLILIIQQVCQYCLKEWCSKNLFIDVLTFSDLGDGDGNPLQYSCLGNPLDRVAWWVTVHGVAKSHTWLRN